MAAIFTLLLLLVVGGSSQARLVERCELVRRLEALGARAGQVATWVCIAQRQEQPMDTGRQVGRQHGVFAINETDWCGREGVGGRCDLACSSLRDENIDDDFRCAQKVFNSLGFEAWAVFEPHCRQPNIDINTCGAFRQGHNPLPWID